MGKVPKVIVFNKHGVGHIARVEYFPRPGETMRALEWKFGEDAGKGTNVAVALGLLGVDTAFVSKVGNDTEGKLGAKWLRNAGVDITHYQMSAGIHTDVGLVITQSDGENVIIGSPAHVCYVSLEEVKKAIDDFDGATYFLSGFEIDQKIPLDACKYAKAKGMITLLNPSPLVGEITQRLDYIDYLFVNEVEGKQLVKANPDSQNSKEIAEIVRALYAPKTVVMTLGSKGCIVCQERKTEFCPSYEVDAVDTVGAGDGFMAAFTAGLSWGMSDIEAADWGNRYSAVVVSRAGAILSYPTLEEAEKFSREYQKHVTKEGVQ